MVLLTPQKTKCVNTLKLFPQGTVHPEKETQPGNYTMATMVELVASCPSWNRGLSGGAQGLSGACSSGYSRGLCRRSAQSKILHSHLRRRIGKRFEKCFFNIQLRWPIFGQLYEYQEHLLICV